MGGSGVRFTAVSRANLDLAKEIQWKVLSPGEWEAGALDPVLFNELGEGGHEVVRLPCHSEAISCTMNRSTAEQAFRSGNKCPCCQQLYASLPGPQPSGVMKARIDPRDCEGHAAGCGSIAVRYEFEEGVQLGQHPDPGKKYHCSTRNVHLPCDDEGREALRLLRLAFERGLLFRVGESVTTGKSDSIVWNGIHQKTKRDGGAANHGYPDPTFLQRLQSECALVGIPRWSASTAHGSVYPSVYRPWKRRGRAEAAAARAAAAAEKAAAVLKITSHAAEQGSRREV